MLSSSCTVPLCLNNKVFKGQDLCDKCTLDLMRGKSARYREDTNHPEYNKGGKYYKKACRIVHDKARYSTPEMNRVRYRAEEESESVAINILSTIIVGIVTLFFAGLTSKHNSKK